MTYIYKYHIFVTSNTSNCNRYIYIYQLGIYTCIMLKTNKIIYSVLLISIICIGFLVFSKHSSGTPVVIGGIFPLSGQTASYGVYLKQGSELALDDAIGAGLIKNGDVSLVMEDSAGDPAKGVAAFQKMVNINNVVAVIPALSGVTLAVKPIGNEKHIAMINGSAISTSIEDADDYMFSILPNADTEGAFLAELAYKQGKRTMGILYRNDSSGVSFDAVFKKRFTELGGHIVYEDSHVPYATDIRAYATKIGHIKGIDGVFVASYGPEVATYLKQSNELSVHVQVYAYTTAYSPKVLEIAGPAAEGLTFSAPSFDVNDSNNTIVQEFKDKIFKKYGSTDNNYYIASHYDAMMILIAAISNGNKTGDQIRNYVANLKTYKGKTGLITFDKNGLGSVPLNAYVVKNGSFEKI